MSLSRVARVALQTFFLTFFNIEALQLPFQADKALDLRDIVA
jgi:hypothetical protein